MFYLFNGQLKEQDDKVSVSPIGEGYQYGMGFFETLLIENEEVEFFEDHMERLRATLDQFDIVFHIHNDEIESGIKDLIRLNHLESGSIKIQVMKTTFGSDLWILTREMPKRNDVFKLSISPWIKGSKNPLIDFKSTQYSANKLALKNAKEQGFDEVLFFNELGFLTEGAYTNVFFIKEHKLYTPSINNGLLAGIMRKKIIEAADALGIMCIETDITLEMMKEMTAGFLTNSLIGVKAFSSIDEIEYEVQELQTWLIHKVKGEK